MVNFELIVWLYTYLVPKYTNLDVYYIISLQFVDLQIGDMELNSDPEIS